MSAGNSSTLASLAARKHLQYNGNKLQVRNERLRQKCILLSVCVVVFVWNDLVFHAVVQGRWWSREMMVKRWCWRQRGGDEAVCLEVWLIRDDAVKERSAFLSSPFSTFFIQVWFKCDSSVVNLSRWWSRVSASFWREVREKLFMSSGQSYVHLIFFLLCFWCSLSSFLQVFLPCCCTVDRRLSCCLFSLHFHVCCLI